MIQEIDLEEEEVGNNGSLPTENSNAIVRVEMLVIGFSGGPFLILILENQLPLISS